MRWVVALGLLVCSAGCQQQADEPVEAAARTGASAANGPATRPAGPPKPISKAVLDAGGVTFDSVAGKTREFAFGASRDEVEQAAARVLGPPDDRSVNAECDAGPMQFARFGVLTLNFQQEKLVGWLAREGPQIVTSDGIRPGTLMRDLKVARSARMINGSTLEGEFDYLAADGQTIGGFVNGSGRDARIESLYAGVNCFFR